MKLLILALCFSVSVFAESVMSRADPAPMPIGQIIYCMNNPTIAICADENKSEPVSGVNQLKRIKTMSLKYRAKLNWQADHGGELWEHKYTEFEDPNQPLVSGDCEELSLSGLAMVHNNAILIPENYGLSIVCTDVCIRDGKKFDHVRAWFKIDNDIFYLDSKSKRGFYKQGRGPKYQLVEHNFYDRPKDWYKSGQ